MKTPRNQATLVRKLSPVFAIILASTLLFSCNKREKQLEAENLALFATLADRDSVLHEFETDFGEIEANLATIRETEARVREWAEGEEVMGNSKDRMVHDLQMINNLLVENRETIQSLEAKIKKNGGQVAFLQSHLETLKELSADQAAEILALQDVIKSKDQEITGLEDELTVNEMLIDMQDSMLAGQTDMIQDQENLIHRQDAELNTVYFASGSYKELKEKGVVESEGAFLGLIGGSKQLADNPQSNAFITMDKRDHDVIPIYSKKAELVTPHPENTYSLEKNDEGMISVIKIDDPEEFWKHSKYLVVAVN